MLANTQKLELLLVLIAALENTQRQDPPPVPNVPLEPTTSTQHRVLVPTAPAEPIQELELSPVPNAPRENIQTSDQPIALIVRLEPTPQVQVLEPAPTAPQESTLQLEPPHA